MKSFTIKLGSLAVCVAVADVRELLETKTAEASSARVSEPGNSKSTGAHNRKGSR